MVSWQPSGSLIAYFQTNTPNIKVNDNSAKAGVLFSEKNCLRHNEFYLNIKNEGKEEKITAKILRWNIDLPLLLVYQEYIYIYK